MIDLPRQNKKKEADFGLILREWIMKNPRTTCTFETKFAHANNSLPFSDVKDKQIAYARAIRGYKGVLIRNRDDDGIPDYTYLRGEPSYIVIKFKRTFCLIDPETWVIESKRSDRRSLTEARAKLISNLTVNL